MRMSEKCRNNNNNNKNSDHPYRLILSSRCTDEGKKNLLNARKKNYMAASFEAWRPTGI